MNGRADDPRFWWRRALADLSSTRIQLTYLVALLFGGAVLRAILLMRTMADAVALLGVLTTPFGLVLAYHMTGKWMDAKQNGAAPPPAPASMTIAQTPGGGMSATLTPAPAEVKP